MRECLPILSQCHGTFDRDWTVKGTSGKITGRFQGTIIGFVYQGTTTGKGSAGFQGMKFNAVFTGLWGGGGASSSGRILDPSGDF